jgi:hypothetical protein
MSQSKVPLLHEVIPLIDTITRALEKAVTNCDLYPAVRASAAKGLFVLNKYYSKTDDSIMYRCAMSELSLPVAEPYFLIVVISPSS